MKKIWLLVALLSCEAWAAGTPTHSAGNYAIGLGPVGNFYLTDRRPEMAPGVGALVYFDYRWSPELSTTATVMMLNQDGTDQDATQNNIVFLAIPAFDLRYYFIVSPNRWDPFALAGIGYYSVTHGAAGRGTASGLGAHVGGGVDYYITQRLSVGITGSFRSIALLGSGSTGSFPISLDGRIGFHF